MSHTHIRMSVHRPSSRFLHDVCCTASISDFTLGVVYFRMKKLTRREVFTTKNATALQYLYNTGLAAFFVSLREEPNYNRRLFNSRNARSPETAKAVLGQPLDDPEPLQSTTGRYGRPEEANFLTFRARERVTYWVFGVRHARRFFGLDPLPLCMRALSQGQTANSQFQFSI